MRDGPVRILILAPRSSGWQEAIIYPLASITELSVSFVNRTAKEVLQFSHLGALTNHARVGLRPSLESDIIVTVDTT